MKRIIFAAMICALGIACLQGQTTNAIREINTIKKAPDKYIYAEGTSATWEEALDNAKTLLSANIELWAKESKINEDVKGFVAKANEHLFEIKATRGQLFRAFVYVKKSDLQPYTSDDQILIVPVSNDTNVQVTHVVPSKDKNEDDAHISLEIDSTFDSEVVVIPPLVVPEVPQPEVVAAEQPVEEPALEEKYEPTERERRILQVVSASQIDNYIREMQSQNSISDFGKYKQMPQNKECYLFVYNQSGEIPAHLHRIEGKYVNVQTGQEDDIVNYKGCGAFWFTFR